MRLTDKLWRRCLRLVRKISKERRIIPSSYTLQEDRILIGQVRYHGGFSIVSDGEYQGCAVAIKNLRMNQGDSDNNFKVALINLPNHSCLVFTQRLCREIITWKHLSHPNILPMLGVSISADNHCFRILTEWMPNGNITLYARSNPAANRLQLVSPLAISSRFLSYLHRILSFLRSCLPWLIFTT